MGILFNGVADIKRTLGFDETYMRTLSEGDAVHYIIRFVVYQFQLDMLLITPHYFTGTVIIDIMRTEYRFRIIRTIRIEFLQVIKEFRRNIPEIYLCIDIYDRTCLFR